MDPASGELASGGTAGQAQQVMANLEAVLKAAGLDWPAVVKTNIFLTNIEDFGQVNQVYASFFPNGSLLPARSTVAVAALPKGARVEIELVAHKG
jgi:2-iminobutanoate/2-iminopropanoate deaminase